MGLLRIALFLTVFVTAVVAADNEEPFVSDSCDDKYWECYEQSYGVIHSSPDGLRNTPFDLQCQLRQTYIVCMTNLMKNCSDIKPESLANDIFWHDFLCVDNYEQTSNLWVCLVDIHQTQESFTCYYQNARGDQCSVDAYSDCFDRVADGTTISDCTGKIPDVKAWDRKFYQEMNQKNLFCMGGRGRSLW